MSLPRNRTESGDEDDEETSFTDDVRHTRIIEVVPLKLLRPGATPVLECEEVGHLPSVSTCLAKITVLGIPRQGKCLWRKSSVRRGRNVQ